MSKTISAAFETRRDAEMAVEHLVQEHGLQANDVEIISAGPQNTAGSKPSGGDNDGASQDGSAELRGNLVVTARVDTAHEEAVMSSIAAYGGRPVGDSTPN